MLKEMLENSVKNKREFLRNEFQSYYKKARTNMIDCLIKCDFDTYDGFVRECFGQLTLISSMMYHAGIISGTDQMEMDLKIVELLYCDSDYRNKKGDIRC